MTKDLREAWLHRVGEAMAERIEEATSATLPKWRVSCGFPSSGGRLGGKTLVRGECWAAAASADLHAEIFINPVLDDVRTVVAILAHELIHAALPLAKHGPAFQKAARAIGHAKPFTSANPTDDFWTWAGAIVAAAGPYPHAQLNAAAPIGQRKKQTARLLKAECETCGYTVRLARKWIEDAGAPICPRRGHGAMLCEAATDDDEPDLAVAA